MSWLVIKGMAIHLECIGEVGPKADYSILAVDLNNEGYHSTFVIWSDRQNAFSYPIRFKNSISKTTYRFTSALSLWSYQENSHLQYALSLSAQLPFCTRQIRKNDLVFYTTVEETILMTAQRVYWFHVLSLTASIKKVLENYNWCCKLMQYSFSWCMCHFNWWNIRNLIQLCL